MDQTKQIYIMENGVKVLKELTYEDVHIMFTPLVEKNVREMNTNMFFNRYNEEDARQESYLQLWHAYEKYDLSKGNCFTTYLFYRMARARDKFFQPSKAQKREGEGKEISLNKEVTVSGSDAAPTDELQNLLVDNNDNCEETLDAKVLLEIIENAVKKDRDKSILPFILGSSDESVAEYAEAEGISKQAAHNRIRVLKAHLREVLKGSYLE